jgi:phenylalanyl-tRNA synthetase beta chain
MAWVPLDTSIRGIRGGTLLEAQVGGKPLGWIGQLDPIVAQKLKLRTVSVGEFDLDVLTAAMTSHATYKAFHQRPPIVRDFAFVVDDAVRWNQLAAAINGAAGELRESTRFVSEFRGKGVDAGKKVYAASVTWRAADRSLTHDEIDVIAKTVIDAVAAATGGTLR